MLTQQDTWMEILDNNTIFNTGGWVTVSSSLGLGLGQMTNLVSANVILTFVIGIGSLIFLAMQGYLTFLKTRREKREVDILNKQLKELKKKKT